MSSQINDWVEAFNKEVASIEIEFNAFFMPGRITDYYKLELDEHSGFPSIHFIELFELPQHIKQRLIEALQNTKPREI